MLKKNRHMAFVLILLGLGLSWAACGLPDSPDSIIIQQVNDLDGGSVIQISSDAGQAIGNETDGGHPVSIDDAGGLGNTSLDAGTENPVSPFDAGNSVAAQPCESSADCFSDAPLCDPVSETCSDCTINCAENSHCEVDATENESCACDMGYVDDGAGSALLNVVLMKTA